MDGSARAKSACFGSSHNDDDDDDDDNDDGDDDDNLPRKCAIRDLGRTRAYSPRLRGPMPYPLGHKANCAASKSGLLQPPNRSGVARRPSLAAAGPAPCGAGALALLIQPRRGRSAA